MQEWYITAYFDRDSRVPADDVPTLNEKVSGGTVFIDSRDTLRKKKSLDDGITRYLGTPYQRTRSKFLGIGSEKVDMYLEIEFGSVMASNPPDAVISLAKSEKPNYSTSSAYSGSSDSGGDFDLLKMASVFKVGEEVLPRSDFDFSQI